MLSLHAALREAARQVSGLYAVRRYASHDNARWRFDRMDSGDRIASPDYTHQEARIARARVVAEIAVGLVLDSQARYWEPGQVSADELQGSSAAMAKAIIGRLAAPKPRPALAP